MFTVKNLGLALGWVGPKGHPPSTFALVNKAWAI